MALYSPVCPIRPVEIDIPFHGSAIYDLIVKKIEIKKLWMPTTKPG